MTPEDLDKMIADPPPGTVFLTDEQICEMDAAMTNPVDQLAEAARAASEQMAGDEYLYNCDEQVALIAALAEYDATKAVREAEKMVIEKSICWLNGDWNDEIHELARSVRELFAARKALEVKK